MALPSIISLTNLYRKKASSSVLRKWEVPGNKELVKETFMRTTLISGDQKKGIPPTLYDAKFNLNQINNVPSMLKLKFQLFKIDNNIGFAYVIPDTLVFDDNSLTTYDLQLSIIDINFSIFYQIYMTML